MMDLPILRYLLTSYDVALRFELTLIILITCFVVFWISQKVFPGILFGEDSEYAGYIYNAMGVVFSLVFAFVTVLVWQNYNGVSDAVAKEATTLNNMYRIYSAFPPEVERKGKEGLRAYVNTVINEEWPMLSNDQFSVKAYQELLVIENLAIHLKPQNLGESNAHQQLLRLSLEATELRRSRIYNARFALAPPAWFGLVSSLVIFLLFSCLFQMKSRRTHVVLLIFLSSTVVGILYFLVLFIHPFLGPMAIGPDPLVNLLKLSWIY
ncbi:DUF4239 domain-containing protein [Polynucleobacter sp. AP-Titi-500A-B4]|uniref:bestrophin-like domain n=1 Tax=Polynucleobacter sp. AP-Titi-500A-B4 TaxID=2576923 RepID=UPI001BFE09CF|nr:DUF4239 domain-containing protein [Polynucleobacter sp. AP-Titi-500A-B4]QWE11932.1 DUF4239 domain-containing protein [Polynucleobacter sp. AP-Titi-500A-B4]